MDILNEINMRITISLILIAMILGCKGYEPLTQERVIYDGKDINTNGYFYTFTKRDIGGYGNEGKKVFDCFVLYQNGIYYNIAHGGYDPNLSISDRLLEIDENIKRNRVEREKEYISVRPYWGVFVIEGSEIKIERWVTASGGGTYPAQKLIGEILNDTTIHFHTKVGAHPINANTKKKTVEIDDTYHFRQFSPKPDSTNRFIE